MKMEVIAVQQQYQAQYGVLGSNKAKDWTSTLRPLAPLSPSTMLPAAANASVKSQTTTSTLPYLQNNTTNKIKNSISKKSKRSSSTTAVVSAATEKARVASAVPYQSSSPYTPPVPQNNCGLTNLFCDDIDAAAVNELSLRLLDELRAAKSRHLSCTEVSLPCDLTPRIAAEIIRVSEKEPCGIRGCTIYIEFEDEPNNSRRIASLKLDAGMVSTFEVYLTLRQDHRGWTALLPQFMKSLARTITISPEFTITKHKLYSPDRSSYSYGASSRSSSAAISTPSS